MAISLVAEKGNPNRCALMSCPWRSTLLGSLCQERNRSTRLHPEETDKDWGDRRALKFSSNKGSLVVLGLVSLEKRFQVLCSWFKYVKET